MADPDRGSGGSGFSRVWGNLLAARDHVLFGILIGRCCCISFITRGNPTYDRKLFGERPLSSGPRLRFFNRNLFFFATLRYEIFIDEIKPKDLSASFLKEFMALPTSYFAAGAPMKYCKCVFHVCFCISLKHDI